MVIIYTPLGGKKMLGNYKNLVSLIKDSENDILAEIDFLASKTDNYKEEMELSNELVKEYQSIATLLDGKSVNFSEDESEAFLKYLQSNTEMQSIKETTAYYMGLRDGILLLSKLNLINSIK